jgi:hypothetical protein
MLGDPVVTLDQSQQKRRPAKSSIFLVISSSGRTRAATPLLYQCLTQTMGQFLTHLEPIKPKKLSHRFGGILIIKVVWFGDVETATEAEAVDAPTAPIS